MRLILTFVLTLAFAAPAAAHGLISHPKSKTREAIHASQLKNLSHARYLCNHGRHQTKHWGCVAVGWLTREARQTAPPPPLSSHFSTSSAWDCIHRYEGSWSSNTGNGYYGGLQMDDSFMRSYGPEFLRRWGTADNWPVWAQETAAQRAHDSGRGFTPWPNTARMCGLL